MSEEPVPRPKRRVRYAGKNPRRFEEKYKEQDPARYGSTIEKVLASGKTPAGTHRPIMSAEILDILQPAPGNLAVDATLGFGGHAEQILRRLLPGGKLIGLDADPIELPKTEARLRAMGFDETAFVAHRSNFAGLARILEGQGADVILADLGVSSMQIDDPRRGFSVKQDGPLDMRMNPGKGQSAAAYLARVSAVDLEKALVENADEPRARVLSAALAGRAFSTTSMLVSVIREVVGKLNQNDAELTVRRVFQAVRIVVNDEFSALETFLRNLPSCLNAGGRAAILTFHSGEDRRVKKFFEAGLREGVYEAISHEVLRPTSEERRANPRSSPAKLRWARKSQGDGTPRI